MELFITTMVVSPRDIVVELLKTSEYCRDHEM